MQTYDTLVADRNTAGSIRHIINFDAVDPAQVLRQCENTVFRMLRVREMTTERNITLMEDSSSIEIAEDWGFLEPIHLQNKTLSGSVMENVRMEILMPARTYDEGLLQKAVPSIYSVFNGGIQFAYRSDQDYELVFNYYSTAGHILAVDNQETFLSKNHFDLLFAAIKSVGAYYRGDRNEEMVSMQQVHQKVRDVNAESDLNLRGANTESFEEFFDGY